MSKKPKDDDKPAMTPAEEKAASRDKTRHELEAEQPVSRDERVKAVLGGYAHGLAHGTPRTESELAELRALLTE